MNKLTYIRHSSLSLGMVVIVASMLLCSCSTTKQASKPSDPKTVAVSEDKEFRDKMQFAFDDKGMDLNVSLAFDETDNILTLKLSANRQMMVFRQDQLYKTCFRHPFLKHRRMEPKKLPYPVLVQPNTRITLSKDVWKGFRKKRRQHVFNNWLTGVSKELQVVAPSAQTDGPSEPPLIVGSIVQHFKVDPMATKASFTLRNILVVDKDGMPIAQAKRTPLRKHHYQIVNDNDLNLTYVVNIQRNPCFGKEAEIAAAEARVKEITKAYANLHEACPTGVVNSQEELGVFNQHRSFLMSQFPARTDSVACPQLQSAIDRYNLYVDSIAKAPCQYIKLLSDLEKDVQSRTTLGISAKAILDAAHRLDNIVSQIVVSRDAVQIHDLTTGGRGIINNLTKAVQNNGLSNEEQNEAYKVFLKAKNYFQSVTQGQWSNGEY